jgi:hypothetical protein
VDTFIASITLGNDAMQTAEDVAGALRTIADQLEGGVPPGQHPIRDVNGNTVGHWAVNVSL